MLMHQFEIVHFAGVRNVEVRPAISTDPNPNRIPNRMKFHSLSGNQAH